ncbi:MAG: hypothetical protein MJ211_02810 [Bacteroidales bacterium]|nr:hypothetical protein [Bacteroidales bacterium]
MKKSLLGILLFFIINQTIAINKNPDFLIDLHTKEELQNPTLFKIDSLEILCWTNRITEPVLAINYAKEAYELALSINSYKDLACIHNYISVILRHYDFTNSSRIHINKALKIAKENNIPREITYAYLNLSNYYYKKADYDSVTISINSALEIAKKSLNDRAIAYCYYQSAQKEISMEEYSIASGFLKRAWEFSNKVSNKTSIHFSIVVSMANNFIDCGMPDETRKYLLNNFNIEDYDLNDFEQSRYWFALGRLYENEKKLDSAYIAFKKSCEYASLTRMTDSRISSLYKLGQTYMINQEFEESAKCFKNAFQMADSSYKSIESFSETRLRKAIFSENENFNNKFLNKSNNINLSKSTLMLIILITIILLIYIYILLKNKRKLLEIINHNSIKYNKNIDNNNDKTNIALKLSEKRYEDLQTKYDEIEQFLNFINNYFNYDIQNPLELIIKTGRQNFYANMPQNELELTFNKMDKISYKYIFIIDYIQKLVTNYTKMLTIKIEEFEIIDYIQNVIAIFKGKYTQFSNSNFKIESKNSINVNADKSLIKDAIFIILYTILNDNKNEIFIKSNISKDYITIIISSLNIDKEDSLIKEEMSITENIKAENNIISLCNIFCKKNLNLQLGNFDIYHTENKTFVFKIELPLAKK